MSLIIELFRIRPTESRSKKQRDVDSWRNALASANKFGHIQFQIERNRFLDVESLPTPPESHLKCQTTQVDHLGRNRRRLL
jgi:hypothetical protein